MGSQYTPLLELADTQNQRRMVQATLLEAGYVVATSHRWVYQLTHQRTRPRSSDEFR